MPAYEGACLASCKYERSNLAVYSCLGDQEQWVPSRHGPKILVIDKTNLASMQRLAIFIALTQAARASIIFCGEQNATLKNHTVPKY